MNRTAFAFVLAGAALALAAPARAQSVEDFYRGKTINILVGFSGGGGYDQYARLLGRHIGRHIPGNPAVTVQNMPGAGSLKATQNVYAVAPKDGLTLATISRGMLTEPLLSGANFDAAKLTWLGSITSETSVCATWKTSQVKTWDDMFVREFSLGGNALGDDTASFALIMRNVFGAKVKLVTGYPGGNDIDLAMERQEVQGRCGWSWSSVKATHPSWLPEKKFNTLFQMGLSKHPELPHTPLIMDLAKTDEDRAIFRLIFGRQVMAWPFLVPPGVPQDRVEALRTAFTATMHDKDFLADAAKAKFEIRSVTGVAIQELVQDIYTTPPAVVRKTVDLLQ